MLTFDLKFCAIFTKVYKIIGGALLSDTRIAVFPPNWVT